MKAFEEKRLKRVVAGRKGGNATAMLQQKSSNATASKVKESKVKQIRVKESKVKESKIEEIKKEKNTHIPTKEKFLLFAKESCSRAGKDYESLKFTIEAKYDSWVEDCWFDGMGNKINNWQTKFNSTLPYLKEIKNKEKGAGRYDVGEQDYTKNEGFEVM